MIEQGGELSASARALLDAARERLTPDAAAVRRVRDKVAASAGAGAGIAIAIKLGLLSVIAVVAVGAAVHVSRGGESNAPAIALPSSGSESAPPQVQGGSVIEAAPPAPAPVVAAAPKVEAKADLAREVALIDRAMVALKTGDAREALAQVHTHARETRGSGQLAEDAAAIEVEALCRLHDATVSAKLDAFDARFPRSAQRSRLTTECP